MNVSCYRDRDSFGGVIDIKCSPDNPNDVAHMARCTAYLKEHFDAEVIAGEEGVNDVLSIPAGDSVAELRSIYSVAKMATKSKPA